MNFISQSVVVQDLNDYGFMEPVLHPGMQILMVIGRDASPNVNKPKHHLAVFTAKDVEVESSKVYVFNAILNKADPRKGNSAKCVINQNSLVGPYSILIVFLNF